MRPVKRFSPREVALLCSPLLLVAVAGLWSRRLVPVLAPNEGPLRLMFRTEKPTTLEAFEGADAVMVIGLQGQGTDDDFYLALQESVLKGQSPRGLQTVALPSTLRDYERRIFVNAKKVPPGKLVFGVNATIARLGKGVPASSPHLQGNWPVNRKLIVPFPFSKMEKAPMVTLSSAVIIGVERYGKNPRVQTVHLNATCHLTGPTMNQETSVEGTAIARGWECGFNPNFGRGKQRDGYFTIYAPPSLSLSSILVVPRPLVHITGRVSADNRWPLAFQIEPFDFNKAKVGQTLKFKSWPAPLPHL